MTPSKYSKILGTGSYIPSRTLTNQELEKMVDTSNEWIIERTGIKERRLAKLDGSETCSEMGAFAAKKAMEAANIKPDEIDLILFATVSPDYKLPSTAAVLQQKLGIKNECPCLDIVAACSGFLYGLVIADSMIKTGIYKNILIIGAELLQPFVDWTDRTTCILFADGAGAAVLGRADENDSSKILSSTLSCDGTGDKLLFVPSGGSASPLNKEKLERKEDKLVMEGKQIFKYATRTMMRNSQMALEAAHLSVSDLQWFIPHQANLRIIEYLAKKLEINMEKIIVTVEKYGNNSAATIPIALDEAVRAGKIKRGDKCAMTAFGAG